MSFCFYPKHEFSCPQLGHRPHLGGAALGALPHVANTSGDTVDRLHRRWDAARQSVSDLVTENQALKREIERLKLELKLERQTKFATNLQRHAGAAQSTPSEGPCQAEAGAWSVGNPHCEAWAASPKAMLSSVERPFARAFAVRIPGAVLLHRNGLVPAVPPASTEHGERTLGVPQEPGRSCRFLCEIPLEIPG
jgi:hypothetical protein